MKENPPLFVAVYVPPLEQVHGLRGCAAALLLNPGELSSFFKIGWTCVAASESAAAAS